MTPPRDEAARRVIETPHLRLEIADSGYVSGIRAGTLLDKRTGAVDLGFGLDVVDFLLEPADPNAPIPRGQYDSGRRTPSTGTSPNVTSKVRRFAPRPKDSPRSSAEVRTSAP